MGRQEGQPIKCRALSIRHARLGREFRKSKTSSCHSSMRNRQPHLKMRLTGTRIDTHITMMLPDDPVNRVEAEAGAFTHRLGGKEWIEDSALDLRRNARSVIDDID